MSRQYPIPEPYSPEAIILAEMLRAKLEKAGTGPSGSRPPRLGIGPITDLLAMMAELLSGPRYVAEALPSADDLGNPDYIVRDQLTGARVARYSGYFAGQDARHFAVIKNEEG